MDPVWLKNQERKKAVIFLIIEDKKKNFLYFQKWPW